MASRMASADIIPDSLTTFSSSSRSIRGNRTCLTMLVISSSGFRTDHCCTALKISISWAQKESRDMTSCKAVCNKNVKAWSISPNKLQLIKPLWSCSGFPHVQVAFLLCFNVSGLLSRKNMNSENFWQERKIRTSIRETADVLTGDKVKKFSLWMISDAFRSMNSQQVSHKDFKLYILAMSKIKHTLRMLRTAFR